MTLHDEVLAELSSVASVRLVASLRDSRLNFPAPDDVRIFLPDMHIVSHRTRAKYSYGTNDMDLLADVLVRLAGLKARSQGRTVCIFQMGDFLDLWREEAVSSARVDAASRIVMDHPRLMNALFSPTLKARFLLGNHDVDLAWWPNFFAWERRYFLPPRGSTQASGVAVHGDMFDWVELLPDAVNKFFVYFFSPLSGAADHDLQEVRTLITRQNNALDFTNGISGPAALGELVNSVAGVPARRNLRDHPFLERACDVARVANRSFHLNLRFMVIGHTHRARIALHDGGGDDFFALIDCGGWIEEASDAAGARFKNQTLAVISENDARIYQLDR
jgi:UDP-2,3-diacylglucosamine pyrophosphatase LpxH